MAKKDYVRQAVARALSRITIAEQRLSALEFAVSRIKRKERYFGTKMQTETNAIRESILEEYREAQQDLFMWGIFDNKQAHKEAFKIAAQQFLDEHREIMSLLEIDGLPPGSYRTSDNEAFREEVLKLIKKQESAEEFTANDPPSS